MLLAPRATEQQSYGPQQIRLRKVRKGTRSCWECKRRKIRCEATSDPDSACLHCERRRLKCISQSYPEDTLPDDRTPVISDFQSFAQQDTTGGFPTEVDSHYIRTDSSDTNPHRPDNSACYWQSSLLSSMWPNDAALEAILQCQADGIGLFHGTICARMTPELFNEISSLRQVLRQPPRDAHPITFARPLLILASHLQSLPRSSINALRQAGVKHIETSQSLFEAVQGNVTCNERLINSIEGIECLAIESMYLNNAGDLLSAWHSTNRAILQGRMMGIDRPEHEHEHRPVYMYSETSKRVQLDFMWFRLLQSSHYLSMMLGLSSHGLINEPLPAIQKFGRYASVEPMQRIDCAAGGLILRQHASGMYDMGTSDVIDQLLREAESCTDESWWTIPDFENDASYKTDLLERIPRTMDQLAHFHMKAQYYLPYLLTEQTSDRSHSARLQVLSASRDILLRYVALGGIHRISAFCRGITLLAFAACVALCIVQVQDVRRKNDQTPRLDDTEFHCRERDRTMMGCTLAVMRRMSFCCDDMVAKSVMSTLEELLRFDPEKTLIERVEVRSAPRFPTDFGWAGVLSDRGQVLFIRVPGISIISFEIS